MIVAKYTMKVSTILAVTVKYQASASHRHYLTLTLASFQKVCLRQKLLKKKNNRIRKCNG